MRYKWVLSDLDLYLIYLIYFIYLIYKGCSGKQWGSQRPNTTRPRRIEKEIEKKKARVLRRNKVNLENSLSASAELLENLLAKFGWLSLLSGVSGFSESQRTNLSFLFHCWCSLKFKYLFYTLCRMSLYTITGRERKAD